MHSLLDQAFLNLRNQICKQQRVSRDSEAGAMRMPNAAYGRMVLLLKSKKPSSAASQSESPLTVIT